MTQQHPITPPPELVEEIGLKALCKIPDNEESDPVEVDQARDRYIASFFAQWGADQELEACCEWFRAHGVSDLSREVYPRELRAARRPKPPNLKEQALALLEPGETRLLNREQQDTIRRALEQLPDNEPSGNSR